MSIFSRYSHKLVKDGIVARINSLKNIPVDYSEELDEEVEKYIDSNHDKIELSNDLKKIIDKLEQLYLKMKLNLSLAMKKTEEVDKYYKLIKKTPKIILSVYMSKHNFIKKLYVKMSKLFKR